MILATVLPRTDQTFAKEKMNLYSMENKTGVFNDEFNKYEEGDSIQLNYTDERSYYQHLSDEEFANFRMVATTGMGEGALYRTASPIDPQHKRNTYADAALKNAS